MACEDCYKMDSVPRGICVIIDNVANENDNALSTNHQLVDTFENLHFNVRSHYRLNHFEFHRVMGELSDTDHTDYDCVVVFISAHGDDNVVCSVDDEDITLEELTDYLKPLNCPTLAGKPKLFFFEACRGEDRQVPVVVEDAVDAVGFPDTYFPNEADFFFGYSTVRSFVSYKNCYKKLVSDTLAQKAARDHLVDMMTEVNRKMSQVPHLTPEGSRVYQSSEMTSRLRKKVFFNQ